MGLYINFTAYLKKETDFKSNSGGVVFWPLAGIFGVLLSILLSVSAVFTVSFVYIWFLTLLVFK